MRINTRRRRHPNNEDEDIVGVPVDGNHDNPPEEGPLEPRTQNIDEPNRPEPELQAESLKQIPQLARDREVQPGSPLQEEQGVQRQSNTIGSSGAQSPKAQARLSARRKRKRKHKL